MSFSHIMSGVFFVAGLSSLVQGTRAYQQRKKASIEKRDADSATASETRWYYFTLSSCLVMTVLFIGFAVAAWR